MPAPRAVRAARGGAMTAVDAPARGWIGLPLPRHEDVRFTTGTARYVDDLVLPDMLYAAFARSLYAHARIVAVHAGDDVEIVEVTHPILAVDRVRYVGQPVAVVVAETREAAADAAELVWLEVEELPAVLDPRAAVGGDVVLHDAAPDNG